MESKGAVVDLLLKPPANASHRAGVVACALQSRFFSSCVMNPISRTNLSEPVSQVNSNSLNIVERKLSTVHDDIS